MARLAKIATAFLLISVMLIQPSVIRAESTGQTVVVDSPTLNVRSGPGLTYSLTDKLKDKQKVEVIDRSGDWLQVSFDGKTGWIASWLTTSSNSENSKGKTIVSRVDSLNIRSSPSITSAVTGKLQSGEFAQLTEYQGEWASIIVDGMSGWVHTTYITEVDSTSENPSETPEVSPIVNANTFTVTVNKLNVRSKPTQTSKRTGTIKKDETYQIEKIDGNWVQIALSEKKSGWVYSFHGQLSNTNQDSSTVSENTVSIVTNGTNIRKTPNTSSDVVLRADAGDAFQVVDKKEGWYTIKLANGEIAYVAEWVVNANDGTDSEVVTDKPKKKRTKGTLKGVTIAIDPGHGGNDRGTTGTRGTDEKDLTLLTAEVLSGKLKDAGAEVILTRNSDSYVSLQKRPAIARSEAADAFVSLHYDANLDRSISGFTTYYTKAEQQLFASAVNDGLSNTIELSNRGTQPANFLVLRENQLPSVLIELGFLSNSSEERVLTSSYFREQAAQGIYKGLLQYFDAQ